MTTLANRKVWLHRHLDTAKNFASFSKDKTKCGCIAVTNDDRILSSGWNGFPRGVEDSDARYNDRDTKLDFVVHSEVNCIYNAAFSGVSLNQCKFFVHAPIHVCNDCAKGIIQVGGTEVHMTLDESRLSDMWVYKWKISSAMFREAGVRYFVHNINDYDKTIEDWTGPGA